MYNNAAILITNNGIRNLTNLTYLHLNNNVNITDDDIKGLHNLNNLSLEYYRSKY